MEEEKEEECFMTARQDQPPFIELKSLPPLKNPESFYIASKLNTSINVVVEAETK